MSRGALFAVLLLTTAALACTRSAPAPRAADATGTARARAAATPSPSTDLAYVCPMDREIRSSGPGKCSRCGMELVAGIPDLTEYHLDMTVTPTPTSPSEQVRLTFAVSIRGKTIGVEKFIVVHEKLFHAFIISRDLQLFMHDHPVWDNGVVPLRHRVSQAGHVPRARRLLPRGRRAAVDCRHASSSPARKRRLLRWSRDYSPKRGDNLTIELLTTRHRTGRRT